MISTTVFKLLSVSAIAFLLFGCRFGVEPPDVLVISKALILRNEIHVEITPDRPNWSYEGYSLCLEVPFSDRYLDTGVSASLILEGGARIPALKLDKYLGAKVDGELRDYRCTESINNSKESIASGVDFFVKQEREVYSIVFLRLFGDNRDYLK